MKRHGQLFDTTFNLESLYQAFLNARKGKRRNVACFRFERSLGRNLHSLHDELMSGTYKPMPLYSFVIHEPKTRQIDAPAFRDCVVQHAVYRVIYPIFDATFSRDSYACRRSFGSHAASDRLQQYMRRCDPDDYYVEMDIRKFFPNIDHEVMQGLLARKIKDQRLLDVMVMFFGVGFKGLPIGCLLSQIYANIYLNEVDQLCKRQMKIGRYIRYMDNFTCVGYSRDRCLDILDRIVEFISGELKLSLSKFTIQKIRKGFNFVGYRTWPGKRFIRKRSLYNYSRALRADRVESVVSILGHALRTNSFRHLLRMSADMNNPLFSRLPESISSRYID